MEGWKKVSIPIVEFDGAVRESLTLYSGSLVGEQEVLDDDR